MTGKTQSPSQRSNTLRTPAAAAARELPPFVAMRGSPSETRKKIVILEPSMCRD